MNLHYGGFMKIAISAESTIDLPKELLEKYNIKTLPFVVILGGEEYKDGEISSTDIFSYVEKNKILPKTSAVNKEQYTAHFQNLLKEYDAVVHICLSSQISCACQNAKDVASEMKNVYVIDSLSLSTGIALLAIYASQLASEGFEPKQVVDRVSARIPSVQASFVIERLDYLYKGGRCSALAYFGANFLRLRPQIIVKEGKMSSYKKYRGNMDKVIANYCTDTLEEFNNPDKKLAFITYTTATEKMLEEAEKALRAKGFETIYETKTGATISSHCGEHTLGILYFNDGTDGH